MLPYGHTRNPDGSIPGPPPRKTRSKKAGRCRVVQRVTSISTGQPERTHRPPFRSVSRSALFRRRRFPQARAVEFRARGPLLGANFGSSRAHGVPSHLRLRGRGIRVQSQASQSGVNLLPSCAAASGHVDDPPTVWPERPPSLRRFRRDHGLPAMRPWVPAPTIRSFTERDVVSAGGKSGSRRLPSDFQLPDQVDTPWTSRTASRSGRFVPL